jgi:hypothetical protein
VQEKWLQQKEMFQQFMDEVRGVKEEDDAFEARLN